eukprot:GILJ01001481.1.p1 GENE.GILJ01001481.1~~GILJ01001481.1.p1  ORF type:complete len:396 (-),score=64.24 GILJ01001481.1:224-1411(-)
MARSNIMHADDDPLNKWWQNHCLELHHQRLAEVAPTIDDTAPKTRHAVSNRESAGKKIFLEEERAAQIHHENQILLKKLVKISQSTTDPSKKVKPASTSGPRTLNEVFRKREAKRIAEENQLLVRRILQGGSQYSTRKWTQDYQKSEDYKRNISRYGPVAASRQAAVSGTMRKSTRLPPISGGSDSEMNIDELQPSVNSAPASDSKSKSKRVSRQGTSDKNDKPDSTSRPESMTEKIKDATAKPAKTVKQVEPQPAPAAPSSENTTRKPTEEPAKPITQLKTTPPASAEPVTVKPAAVDVTAPTVPAAVAAPKAEVKPAAETEEDEIYDEDFDNDTKEDVPVAPAPVAAPAPAPAVASTVAAPVKSKVDDAVVNNSSAAKDTQEDYGDDDFEADE